MADTRRRILLAQLLPRVPQPPELLHFVDSAAALGSGVTCVSDTRVDLATADDNYHTALAVPKNWSRTGTWYCEAVIDSIRGASGDGFVGLAPAGIDLDGGRYGNHVGMGIAVNVSDGSVWFDGEAVDFTGIDSGDLGDTIGVQVDFDAGVVSFSRMGGRWFDVDDVLAPGLADFLGSNVWLGVSMWETETLLGPSLYCTVNFGQAAFDYGAKSIGVHEGMWQEKAPKQTAIYAGSEGYTDSVASPARHYIPRIARDPDFEIERGASCWPWGKASSAKQGQLSLVNIDGALDEWLTWDWRDAWVRVYAGWEGDAFATFVLWTQAVVNDVQASEDRLTIRLLDSLALLDRAMQLQSFPSDTQNAVVRGQTIPLVIGRPQYCTPVLVGWDAGLPKYQLTHAAREISDFGFYVALGEVDNVLDRGDPLIPVTDWNYIPDDPGRPSTATGFKLENVPDGPVVCNPTGWAEVDPGVSIDVFETLARVMPYLVSMAPATKPTAHPAPGFESLRLEWSAADLTGLQSEINHPICDYITRPETILAKAREILDCWTGWVVPDRAGKLRFGRLELPDESAPPALMLDPSTVVGTPTIAIDTAPGLTLRLAGLKNFTPHSDADIVGIVVGADREKLKAQWLKTVIAHDWDESPVSAAYAAALAAPEKGLPTWHYLGIEANRLATLWHTERHFFTLTAVLDAEASDAIEPGQQVMLTWPRFGLDSGALLRVVSVRTRFFSRRVDLTLWG